MPRRAFTKAWHREQAIRARGRSDAYTNAGGLVPGDVSSNGRNVRDVLLELGRITLEEAEEHERRIAQERITS